MKNFCMFLFVIFTEYFSAAQSPHESKKEKGGAWKRPILATLVSGNRQKL